MSPSFTSPCRSWIPTYRRPDRPYLHGPTLCCVVTIATQQYQNRTASVVSLQLSSPLREVRKKRAKSSLALSVFLPLCLLLPGTRLLSSLVSCGQLALFCRCTLTTTHPIPQLLDCSLRGVTSSGQVVVASVAASTRRLRPHRTAAQESRLQLLSQLSSQDGRGRL